MVRLQTHIMQTSVRGLTARTCAGCHDCWLIYLRGCGLPRGADGARPATFWR
jgi:hypothetical protein